MKIKTYSELIKLPTFEERFRYLKLDGTVGQATFGFDRYLNQVFYTSGEWHDIRDYVITRDGGYDLAHRDHEIGKDQRIYVHHMNPISIEDVLSHSDFLLNPDFLVTTIHSTHNAIHFSDENFLILKQVERTKNDTCPWKKN